MCEVARNKLYKAFVEVRNGAISDETRRLLLRLLDEEYKRINDEEKKQ